MKDIDREVARLKELYENETDDELERKRGVYRSHIVLQTQEKIKEGATDLEMNRALYDVLTDIVHRRERRRRRLDTAKILAAYLGIFLPFVPGVIFSDPVKKFLGWE